MGIETSIYGLIQPAKVDVPNYLDSANRAMDTGEKMMKLSQLGLQTRQQQALRQAYAQNTDPNTGQVNQQGVLSALGKMGMGQQAMDLGGHFSQLAQEQAKAQQAQYEAGQQRDATVAKRLHYIMQANPADQARLYQDGVKELTQQGILKPGEAPEQFDAAQVGQLYDHYKTATPHLKDQLTEAEIGAKRAEAALAPVKLQNELYGSRSPNAELTSQYDKQIQNLRGSAGALNQMMDNYRNRTPQGDASLMLNAFKIKFPNAPDVNSLEELAKSQSVPDQWKQAISHRVNGLFDDNTVKNLLRDGISTYRANYETGQGIRQRFQGRQQVQGVKDPTLTAEPMMDTAYSKAMKLQDEVGPYLPPSQREGSMASKIGKFLGAGDSTANASEKAPPAGGFSLSEIKAELARRKGGKGK